ncbi:MAG TPA: MFS transporter [Kofleriaceae bacterium]|nr:MFS transporter [Kofleriaceae bacterium]
MSEPATRAPELRDEPAKPRTLWRHGDFLRLWSAQAVSAFGSRITRIALPIIAVTTLGQTSAMLGVLAAMQLVPGVILAMAAGGFVDRGRKRRILIGADLVRGVLVASLTLSWALGALTMAQVLIVGAGVGAASALFQITDVAYLPTLIDRRSLVEGNAKLETTEALAEITGPASAGVLIAALGAPFAVAIDAVSYFWSAFMLGRIRTAERSVARPAVATPARRGESFRVGMRAVFGHPLLRPIVIALMIWSLLGGFFMSLYTLYCLRDLQLSEATFGVIIAMGGVGSLAGAVLARTLSQSLGVGWTLILTSALSLACAAFIPLASIAPSHAVMIGFLAAHQVLSDCFAVSFIILSVTLRQTVLPKELLGRANAAVHVCTSGVLPIAALLAGVLAHGIGARDALWIGVGVSLLAPISVWPLRKLKAMPVPAIEAP